MGPLQNRPGPFVLCRQRVRSFFTSCKYVSTSLFFSKFLAADPTRRQYRLLASSAGDLVIWLWDANDKNLTECHRQSFEDYRINDLALIKYSEDDDQVDAVVLLDDGSIRRTRVG